MVYGIATIIIPITHTTTQQHQLPLNYSFQQTLSTFSQYLSAPLPDEQIQPVFIIPSLPWETVSLSRANKVKQYQEVTHSPIPQSAIMQNTQKAEIFQKSGQKPTVLNPHPSPFIFSTLPPSVSKQEFDTIPLFGCSWPTTFIFLHLSSKDRQQRSKRTQFRQQGHVDNEGLLITGCKFQPKSSPYQIVLLQVSAIQVLQCSALLLLEGLPNLHLPAHVGQGNVVSFLHFIAHFHLVVDLFQEVDSVFAVGACWGGLWGVSFQQFRLAVDPAFPCSHGGGYMSRVNKFNFPNHPLMCITRIDCAGCGGCFGLSPV